MSTVASAVRAPITALDACAYTVPCDQPEEDGTMRWTATTCVVVRVHAGGEAGLGYTYGAAAIAPFVRDLLADAVHERDAMDVGACWTAMSAAIRNAGRPGLGAMAIAAVDAAIWDVKARVLGVALVDLLGAAHDEVPVYGSGGFTSYTPDRIAAQLGNWVEEGIPRVKMKVGRRPDEDPARLDAARAAIGFDAELFADANGAWTRKQALAWADRLGEVWDVRWLEEPVSSDDVDGLRLLRDRAPAGMDVAAGEYGFLLGDFRRWLEAGAVDCLQADVTRCMGISGLLRVAALCDAHQVDLSGHCAPALSVHPLAACARVRHLEYFHDHVQVERLLFDGTLEPVAGALRPDRSRAGNGLELRRAGAERYRSG